MFPQFLLSLFLYFAAVNSKSRRSLFSPITKNLDAKRVVRITSLTEAGPQFCTGVLLSEYVVLTAAHCIFNEELGKEPLLIDVENEKGSSKVKKFFLHNDYRPSAPCNDVALLILENGVPTSRIPIYFGCGKQWISGNCSAYGLGITEDERLSESVREVHFKVFDPQSDSFRDDTCWETFYTTRAKLCQGDSGGPVICRMDGKSIVMGVNIQVISTYYGEDILTLCKMSYGSIISNYRAISELLTQIPVFYQRFILNDIRTLDC
ncbi:unnamed protein product [Bursaphelenchus xylophilus]|uniref:(pine wood nematode) hypothetical protein n=1 Tax=Bursaphelenchus xylophilus TaxID=6326 RepID=A0A1I7S3S8_BURXY|nr:unnamed protein product [Bursaphelenchus xylophilus]CAG9116499.1 unnamed protein product [Bursaphelenchus xylophilus]